MTDARQVQMSDQTPPRQSVARPAIVGGIIALLLFAGFAALAFARQSYVTSAFDSTVVSAVHGWRADVLTPWVIRLTNMGSAFVAVPVAIVAVLIAVVRRKPVAAVYVVAVLGLGYLAGNFAQNLIARVRPPQAQALIPVPAAFSYPSGHSITALLTYGAVAVLIWRIGRSTWERVVGVLVCAVIIVGVGVSRVYLGVHWPTDVLGAWLLGGAWLSLMTGLYLTWLRYQELDRQPTSRGGA